MVRVPRACHRNRLMPPSHRGEQSVAVTGLDENVTTMFAWVRVGAVFPPPHATAPSSTTSAHTRFTMRTSLMKPALPFWRPSSATSYTLLHGARGEILRLSSILLPPSLLGEGRCSLRLGFQLALVLLHERADVVGHVE